MRTRRQFDGLFFILYVGMKILTKASYISWGVIIIEVGINVLFKVVI